MGGRTTCPSCWASPGLSSYGSARGGAANTRQRSMAWCNAGILAMRCPLEGETPSRQPPGRRRYPSEGRPLGCSCTHSNVTAPVLRGVAAKSWQTSAMPVPCLGEAYAAGTGVGPVKDHGQDAHATKELPDSLSSPQTRQVNRSGGSRARTRLAGKYGRTRY